MTMSLRAGFAEIDITPPVGTRIAGWIKEIISTEILDPLHARVAILECDGETIAFVQLDTLSVRWTITNRIRDAVKERYGYPGERIMVSATHNHAGPAISGAGLVQRDDAFAGKIIEAVVDSFGKALERMQDAEIGMGSVFEFNVARNRRVVMRDGTVRTHGRFDTPDALYVEGPIDPEVAVIAVRNKDKQLLGCLVNFACHATHHGSDGKLSAGFPGALANEMKERGCPCTLFLNGAAGNMHFSNPMAPRRKTHSEQRLGGRLAKDVGKVLRGMKFRNSVNLSSSSRTIQLPYRAVSEAEIAGSIRGAQRFISSELYDKAMPRLLDRIKERGLQPAEIQVNSVDDWSLVSIPAEMFVELGLKVKVGAHPRHALVVGYANGMIGYIPHKEAFERGGYETTFSRGSRMAREAGDMLVECAIDLIRKDSGVLKG